MEDDNQKIGLDGNVLLQARGQHPKGASTDGCVSNRNQKIKGSHRGHNSKASSATTRIPMWDAPFEQRHPSAQELSLQRHPLAAAGVPA
jgi:hypothetical protein